MNACTACGIETDGTHCPGCGHETAPKVEKVPSVNELTHWSLPAQVKEIIASSVVPALPAGEGPSVALSKALEQINAKLDALNELLLLADAHARTSEADRDELLKRILTEPAPAATPSVPELGALESYAKDIIAKLLHQADERAAANELREIYGRQLDVAGIATRLVAAWSTSDVGQVDPIMVTAAVGYAQQIIHEASKPWSPPDVPVVPVSAPTAG